MNLSYLIVHHELSDEAAALVSEILNDLAVVFDGQYFAHVNCPAKRREPESGHIMY